MEVVDGRKEPRLKPASSGSDTSGATYGKIPIDIQTCRRISAKHFLVGVSVRNRGLKMSQKKQSIKGMTKNY